MVQSIIEDKSLQELLLAYSDVAEKIDLGKLHSVHINFINAERNREDIRTRATDFIEQPSPETFKILWASELLSSIDQQSTAEHLLEIYSIDKLAEMIDAINGSDQFLETWEEYVVSPVILKELWSKLKNQPIYSSAAESALQYLGIGRVETYEDYLNKFIELIDTYRQVIDKASASKCPIEIEIDQLFNFINRAGYADFSTSDAMGLNDAVMQRLYQIKLQIDAQKLIVTSALSDSISTYIKARHAKDPSQWHEEYKWTTLPEIQSNFFQDRLTESNILERIEGLQSANPTDGVIVNWNELEKLKIFAKEYPEDLVYSINELLDEKKPVWHRVDSFVEHITAKKPQYTPGLEIVSVLLALSDNRRNPLYKLSTWQTIIGLVSNSGWSEYSAGTRYAIYRDICEQMGKYLLHSNLIKPVSSNAGAVRPGVYALDGQDYFYYVDVYLGMGNEYQQGEEAENAAIEPDVPEAEENEHREDLNEQADAESDAGEQVMDEPPESPSQNQDSGQNTSERTLLKLMQTVHAAMDETLKASFDVDNIVLAKRNYPDIFPGQTYFALLPILRDDAYLYPSYFIAINGDSLISGAHLPASSVVEASNIDLVDTIETIDAQFMDHFEAILTKDDNARRAKLSELELSNCTQQEVRSSVASFLPISELAPIGTQLPRYILDEFTKLIPLMAVFGIESNLGDDNMENEGDNADGLKSYEVELEDEASTSPEDEEPASPDSAEPESADESEIVEDTPAEVQEPAVDDADTGRFEKLVEYGLAKNYNLDSISQSRVKRLVDVIASQDRQRYIIATENNKAKLARYQTDIIDMFRRAESDSKNNYAIVIVTDDMRALFGQCFPLLSEREEIKTRDGVIRRTQNLSIVRVVERASDATLGSNWIYFKLKSDHQALAEWLQAHGCLLDSTAISAAVKESDAIMANKLGKEIQIDQRLLMISDLDQDKLEAVINYQLEPMFNQLFDGDIDTLKSIIQLWRGIITSA